MSNKIREIEVFLLRLLCASNSPLAAVENLAPGNGVLTAYDDEGRTYHITITEGPKQ